MDRVAVIVERSLVRAGLVNLLQSQGFKDVDEAASLCELMQSTAGAAPEIILVSLSPSMNISESMSEILQWNPAAKVVFVAPDFDIAVLGECFAAGASGYILSRSHPNPSTILWR